MSTQRHGDSGGRKQRRVLPLPLQLLAVLQYESNCNCNCNRNNHCCSQSCNASSNINKNNKMMWCTQCIHKRNVIHLRIILPSVHPPKKTHTGHSAVCGAAPVAWAPSTGRRTPRSRASRSWRALGPRPSGWAAAPRSTPLGIASTASALCRQSSKICPLWRMLKVNKIQIVGTG